MTTTSHPAGTRSHHPEQLIVEDIGPHAGRMAIPFKRGRITVLRGGNGAGKSKIQEAADYYLTGRGDKPQARWGSGGGRIEGFGKVVNVGLSRCSSREELLVDTFDGGVDIGLWIDPGVDDPEKADMRRIKLLCLIANVQPDIAAFAELVGGMEALNKIAPPETIGAADVVEMAAKVRRRLQAVALDEKNAAEAAEGTSSGLRQAVGAIDLDAEADEATLHARVEAATSHRARLLEQSDAAARARRAAETAQQLLAQAETGYVGPTVAEAATAAHETAEALRARQAAVVAAQAALSAAQDARSQAEAADALARQRLAAAEQHDRDLASAREALAGASAVTPAPSAEDHTAADQAVADARAAVDRGARVRLAREQLRNADAAAAAAAECRRNAARLTDAARGTDEVLTKLLAKVVPAGIKIGNGARLLTQQGDAEVFVHSLSPGQLGRQAVGLLMETAPAGAFGTINQIVWEGLDGNARLDIAQKAHECQIALLTAEADRTPGEVGPLRAEDYPYGFPGATAVPAATSVEGGAQ